MEPTNQIPSLSFNPGANKKNLLLWLLVIFAALAVVFFSAFCVKKYLENRKNQKVAQMDQRSGLKAVSELLPKVECLFKDDEEAYKRSIENLNKNTCNCIEEVSLKEKCEKTYFSLSLYEQAIKDTDIEKCDLINEQTTSNACKNIIKNKIKFLENNE